MKYLVLALLIALLAPSQAMAQSAYDKAYMEMVETAKTMPPGFDFKTLRGTYIRTTFYSPFGEIAYKEKLFGLVERARQGDAAALQDAHMMADQYFANYKIHSYMMASKLLTEEQIKFHVWALKGIAGSIIDGNDASSPEKAIKVIDVSEEYFLIRSYFGGKPAGKQSTLKKDGRIFDLVEYTDKAGSPKTAYFDVTIPFTRYPTGEDKKAPAKQPAQTKTP